MRRPSTSPPFSRGRRGSTACGCASASSRCRRGRCPRRSPAEPVSGSMPGAAAARSGRCAKPQFIHSGGPEMAPTPPDARKRPGEAVPLLGPALLARGPEMAPTPPDARKRPGEAVPLLGPALLARGPEMAPTPPDARKRPGEAVPLLGPALLARGPEMAPTPPNARKRPGEAVPLLGPALLARGPEMAPTPPALGSGPATPGRSSVPRFVHGGRYGPH